jgi:hypothetical protein
VGALTNQQKRDCYKLTNPLRKMYEKSLKRSLTEEENLILQATYIKAIEDTALGRINVRVENGEVITRVDDCAN